jgi:hypothetical protein
MINRSTSIMIVPTYDFGDIFSVSPNTKPKHLYSVGIRYSEFVGLGS